MIVLSSSSSCVLLEGNSLDALRGEKTKEMNESNEEKRRRVTGWGHFSSFALHAHLWPASLS